MSTKHQAIKASDWTAGRSPFFGAAQLEPYGALLVTIESTSIGESPEGGGAVPVIHFRGWAKPIICSARCNRLFLQQLFGGTTTREWPGKQVWIYYDPTAMYGGETRGGIRFAWGERYSGQLERRRKGQPKPPRPTKPTPIPTEAARPSAPTFDPSADDAEPQQSEPRDREPGEED